jgi:hypothetical protein
MDLDYISPLQASEKWGITERQVQSLCKQGKIKEVIKWGRSWLIHKDAVRPIDGRIRNGKKNISDANE